MPNHTNLVLGALFSGSQSGTIMGHLLGVNEYSARKCSLQAVEAVFRMLLHLNFNERLAIIVFALQHQCFLRRN
jgi:hypothetical protein